MLSAPSGNSVHHLFQLSRMIILPTQCVHLFHMIGINRHTLNSTSQLVFIMGMHYVFCDVGNDFLKIIHTKF